ncbi:hypothetical protein DNHGIG_38420 [Collibacillus ludicampi]|jgi:hypothetical protein|uniref:DUF4227 family protein n=1 Tax=Collibacillus ludicampi TaxID=2771369 RepID=A0AAV4LKE0_9BACL|nr:DUF4227 family protein [Collibacillus ludicampi]GIM48293.1 hypothetical protein DNHGIG_38420 [Collibacillus ludicampi]
MIISVRRWIRYLRMTVYIVLFSFVLFKLFGVFQEMVQHTDPYREPRQDAVKVHALNDQQGPWWKSWLERLVEFYMTGE